MVVRQFPPSESCRMRVILLSRYGTWDFYKEIKRSKERGLKIATGSEKDKQEDWKAEGNTELLQDRRDVCLWKTKNMCCLHRERTKEKVISLSLVDNWQYNLFNTWNVFKKTLSLLRRLNSSRISNRFLRHLQPESLSFKFTKSSLSLFSLFL